MFSSLSSCLSLFLKPPPFHYFLSLSLSTHTHTHTHILSFFLPFHVLAYMTPVTYSLQISVYVCVQRSKGSSPLFSSLAPHLYKLKTLIRLRPECQVWHQASNSIFFPSEGTRAGKRGRRVGETERKQEKTRLKGQEDNKKGGWGVRTSPTSYPGFWTHVHNAKKRRHHKKTQRHLSLCVCCAVHTVNRKR